MSVLFLESVAGVAGDMFAASFVDAGLVTEEELRAIPAQLGLEGVRIAFTRPLKATTKTTHLDVSWTDERWKSALGKPHSHSSVLVATHSHDHWHTHYRELDAFLERSALDAATKSFARKVFRLIAEAEADAHGVGVEEVSFHEVGAVDSIVDVVMAGYCVAKVKPGKVYATPVKLGRGLIKIEHGTHPVPPPAAARLAKGLPVAPVPAGITRENVELSTPTGLAIIQALTPTFVDGVPAGRVRAQGSGSGTMDLGAYPNIFRVMVLDEAASASLPYERDEVVEISCNMDDETAERTAWVMEKLLTEGALDAWVTPMTGKKGRAAVQLSVLCSRASFEKLADWLLRHSSTFGLRYATWDRLKLARKFEKRGEVSYKIGMTTDGQVLKEKPEFEDVRKLWDKS